MDKKQSKPAREFFDISTGKCGDYQLVNKIGGGGMGVVYKAYDTKHRRMVALKMLNVTQEVSQNRILRFLREAKALVRLQHPHIVRLYDIGQQGRLPYLVMELVEGVSLEWILDHRSQQAQHWPVPRLLQVMVTVARALDYAHQHGIIHRDISPANIMLVKASGEPKLMDFGLSKAQWSAPLTQEGVILGTPLYMSPEEINGQSADQRSDIYSLGVILYSILTGRLPYQARDPLKLFERVITTTAPAPCQCDPRIPRQLSRICMKAMAKSPARRYAQAKELAQQLENFLQGGSKLQTIWNWLRGRKISTAFRTSSNP